ncbi:TPA: hypothetical protein PTV31_003160 [Clostridium botulinum]|nr:hypothetical protein [Clostridium botulinum]
MNFFTINILIGAMAFTINKINNMNRDIDPFESFNKIQESLEKIDNEKTRQRISRFVNGLINASTINPLMGYVFMFVVYMTPILNLLLLISDIVDYFKEVDN